MTGIRRVLSALRWLLLPLLALCALLWFSTALNQVETGHDRQGKARLEESLRRSAAACYAAEGIYPPDLAYLQEHYGVQIDEERYTVYYDVFASNLMPDITVLENES